MKKIFKFFFVAMASVSVMSCDALFDNIEGDLSKMTAEDMLRSETGIKAILANIYSSAPSLSISTGDQQTMFAAGTRTGESYGASVDSFWSYGTIRTINKFIESLDQACSKGVITEQTRDQYKGEAIFIRAYEYFHSVRTLGGIPFVFEVLDSKYDGGENLGLYIPRTTEKEAWDILLDEFQKAFELLPDNQGAEVMRANKWTAMAYKAKVALWAASESKYWNNAPIPTSYQAVKEELTFMKPEWANDYYKVAIESAKKVIDSGRYELVGANPSNAKAATDNLVNLFQKYDAKEGIFGRSYAGSATDTNGIEQEKQGGWFRTGAYLSGTYAVTLNMADVYDNIDANGNHYDGTIQVLEAGNDYTYYVEGHANQRNKDYYAGYKRYPSVTAPFENKDPRFQAWVVYPGAEFRGGPIAIQGGMIKPNGDVLTLLDANAKVTGNDGADYYVFGAPSTDTYCFENPGNVNEGNRNWYGFWIKKYLDPNGLNITNQSPWYAMRYSEMLLTYAEAVVESGLGDRTLAAKYLNDIRHRAGFKDNVDLTLDNVLHEWKVEFAFENQWSSVCWRRRAFYTFATNGNDTEGHLDHKLALVPMVDLTGSEPQYIFVRALQYFTDEAYGNKKPARFDYTAENYYGQISNYQKNKLTPNNK